MRLAFAVCCLSLALMQPKDTNAIEASSGGLPPDGKAEGFFGGDLIGVPVVGLDATPFGRVADLLVAPDGVIARIFVAPMTKDGGEGPRGQVPFASAVLEPGEGRVSISVPPSALVGDPATTGHNPARTPANQPGYWILTEHMGKPTTAVGRRFGALQDYWFDMEGNLTALLIRSGRPGQQGREADFLIPAIEAVLRPDQNEVGLALSEAEIAGLEPVEKQALNSAFD